MATDAEAPSSFIAELLDLLGPRGVLLASEDRARFETGWRYGNGQALAIARPASTEEVAQTLRLCAQHGVRVIAQGANTGLVAASTPDASGEMLVLALERLNTTLEIDTAGRTAVVSGGVLLSQLNEQLAPHGLWFPIDLGADPQIGGMIATNTGGTRLLKYGDVRHNLLGLEVVLGNGAVIDALHSLRKNNTGLDSKQLFVGTSGVFGVVTKAVLRLAPLPRQRTAALVGCGDGASVLQLLNGLESHVGELLSAFEVMSANAMRAVFAHQPDLRDPFRGNLPPFCALIELSTTLPENALPLDDLLTNTLGEVAETIGDGLTDVFVDRGDGFWDIRHRTSESLRSDGQMLAFDVSVPRSSLPTFTAEVTELLRRQHPFVKLCDYGHWGDGGTHLNLVWQEQDAAAAGLDGYAAVAAAIQPAIYELAVRGFAGSFSAEHGVGPHNHAYYERYTSAAIRALCGALRAHCDPERLLGTLRLD